MSQARSTTVSNIRNHLDDNSIIVSTQARWMVDGDMFDKKMAGDLTEAEQNEYYVYITVRAETTDIDHVTAKMDELGYDLHEDGWEKETLDQRDIIKGEQSGRIAFFC